MHCSDLFKELYSTHFHQGRTSGIFLNNMFELTLLQIVLQQAQQWLPQRDLEKVTEKVSLLTASLNSEQRLHHHQ